MYWAHLLNFYPEQVSCKVINVRSGAELPEKCRELALHFEDQGTPIMIGQNFYYSSHISKMSNEDHISLIFA